MWTIHGILLASVWTLTTGLVDGIQVPSKWQPEVAGNGYQSNGQNYAYPPTNQQPKYNTGIFSPDNIQYSPFAPLAVGKLYVGTSSSPSNSIDFKNPKPGLNALPQYPKNLKSQEPLSAGNTQQKPLPPLRNPRYPIGQSTEDYLSPNRLKYLESVNGDEFTKNHNLPDNVLKIKPAVIDPISQLKQSGKPLSQFAQVFDPERFKNPTQSISPSLYSLYLPNAQFKLPLKHALDQHVPQQHKFIVSASEADSNQTPLDLEPEKPKDKESSSKEPIFFVTEGYRNVLVQGANKKKAFHEPQIQKKGSKKIFKEHKPNYDTKDDEEDDEEEDDDEEDDEAEPVPREKTTTKGYSVKDDKEDKDASEGFSRNYLKPDWEKPTSYFERPLKYFDEEKKSRFAPQLKTNYRDDTLHEPENDRDFDRDDDDEERITEDDEEDDDDEDDEKNVAENIKKSGVKDEISSPNKAELKVNKDSKQETSKSETSEAPIEEEETDEKPVEEETDGEDENEEIEQVDDKELKLVDNEHAEPKPIPTKPIYPGPGLWAKPGLKHTPHITQHRFLKPMEDEVKPDGYDVFEDLERFFQKQKVNIGNAANQNAPVTAAYRQPQPQVGPAIKAPNLPNPLVVYDPFKDGSRKIPRETLQPFNQIQPAPAYHTQQFEANRQAPIRRQYEEPTTEFVPSRLYAQVRKSEDVSHEPRNPAKHGRLKEVIKDSKVQTVYSEEGYEDAAYDHAGHEKKAEEDKAYSQFQRGKQGKGTLGEQRDDSDAGGSKIQPVVSEPPKEVLLDSLTSGSDYLSPEEIHKQNTTTAHDHSLNIANKNENVNNFISTKETRTTQVKDKDNGDLQLEIESEVKVIMQPNNSTKAHKFVKIYPKVLQKISVDSYEDDNNSSNDYDDYTRDDDQEEDDNDDERDEDGGFKNYLSDTESGNVEEDDDDKYFLFAKANNTLNSSESLLNSDELRSPINNSQSNSSEMLSSIFPSTTESSTVSNIEAMTRETILNKTDTRNNSSKDSQLILEETKGINLKRKKRSSDSYEDVEIDTDFIDKINHTFAPAVTEGLDLVKYPYYRKPGVNKDSPLRYAETTKNIPIKKAGELSFYNMADQFQCPDLPEDIDPVPERIQNARTNEDIEESEDEYEDDDESVVDRKQPKKVRIELGDKIDCLKLRYFGENPLDNPLFKESTISPVKPIFKELERKPRQKKSHKPIDNSFNPSEIYEQINEIFNYDDKNDDDFGTGLNDKIFSFINTPTIKPRSPPQKRPAASENEKAESTNSNSEQPAEEEESGTITTPNSLISLITTPKYTIQLTPNNIYDQIKLLDHLPGEEFITGRVQDANAATARDRMDEPDESISPNIEIVQTVERTQINERSKPNQRDPRVLQPSGNTATVSSVDSEKESSKVFEPEAWRRQRVGIRRPPLLQIFDVTKFLTTTPFSVINTAPTTVLPKHKVMSEVFYKEEIKPSEQLTVFADILNNIKNSTNNDKVPMQSSSNFAEPGAVTISTLEAPSGDLERTKLRVKKFQTDSSNGQNDFGDVRPEYKSPSRRPHRQKVPNNIQSSSNHQPNIAKRPVAHRTNHNNIEFDLSNFSGQSDDPLVQSTLRPQGRPSVRKVLKRRRKPTTTTTPAPTTTTAPPKVDIVTQNIAANHKPYVIDYIEDVEQVIGLVPPQNSKYRTIIFDDSEVGDSKVADQIYDYEGVVPSAPRDSAPAKQPAPVTEIAEEVSSPRQLNKYYFVGLKPPNKQRAMSYSEFTNNNLLVNDNLLRRRVAHVGYLRDKRNAARPSYADLSRNRGRQSDAAAKTQSEADADDYVPHRPRNYHYDEKTGKIVYHSNPQQAKSEEDDEEYEELEVKEVPGIYLERAEGATHPTKEKVTTKPLLATATPPPEGKGLLDFVVQLKNDKKYTYIPDPTTPKPGSEPTAAASVTVDPKTTDPPEFLSILSKVKSDKTYKYVEDPKESQSKQKAVSTTPSRESNENEEDGEEESEEESAGKPRPTRQITNLKIFNIGDFLPKIYTLVSSPPKPAKVFKTQVVERIIPRLQYVTPYDIEREYYKQTELYKYVKKLAREAPKRQSLADLQIFDIGEYLPTIRPIDYSKYKTIERPRTRPQPEDESQSEVVTRRPSSGPGGEPAPADRRRLSIEEKESVDAPVVSEEKVGHDKKQSVSSQNRPSLATTQRILQLRRGTRPTAKATKSEEPAVTRRTFNRYRPAGSTRRTTTSSDFDEASEGISKYSELPSSEGNDKARRVYRRRPVRIKSTTQKHEIDDEDDDSDHRRVRRSADSIKESAAEEHLEEPSFDATYKSTKKEIINGDDTVNRDYGFGDKSGRESKREILTVQPDNVEVINRDYDKDRKHGGNYRRENEEDATEPAPELVETADVKDKLEAKTSGTDLKDEETVRASKKVEVEVVDKNYDKTQKHGGNYKAVKDTLKDASQHAAEEEVQSITDNYEKTKLRAGGFRSRSAQVVNQKEETEQKDTTTDNVQIINENYDKTKKHGGNYKSDTSNEEDEDTVIAEEETRADAKIAEEPIPAKPVDAALDFKKPDAAVIAPEPDSYSKPEEDDTPTDELLDDKEISEESDESSEFPDPIDESDFTDDPFDENIHSRRYLKPQTTTLAPLKIVSRLSDVIPKPDHFYSDPQLPGQINKLGSEKVNVKLASEELDQLAVEGDVVEEIHRPQRRGVEIEQSYFHDDFDGDRKKDGRFEEDKLGSSTKKPLFEKDPSKRLYFYLSN